MPFLLMSAFRGLVDAVHADLEEAGFPGVRATHGFATQAVGAARVSSSVSAWGLKQAATKTAAGLEAMGLSPAARARRTAGERI